MSINKTTIDNELRRINNMLMLKDGNICFSSDFGEFVIFKLNWASNFSLIQGTKFSSG